MYRNSFIPFIILFCAVSHVLLAQEPEITPSPVEDIRLIDVDQLLESELEQTDETFEFDTYFEALDDYSARPLNLNAANLEQLQRLRLLTDKQANAIIRHRERYGKFISMYELQAVTGLDLTDIERIRAFVKIRDDLDSYRFNNVKELLFGGDHTLFIRFGQTLETQRGYTPVPEGSTATRYLGGPQRLYLRYRYNFGDKLSYGFTTDKDAGEEFFGKSQPRGFDFYSGHLFIRRAGPFKHVAVGDYEVMIGQGLILWSGFGFGKSPFVTNVKRQGEVLRPYTSVNENRFMRGAATTIQANNFEITGFVSRDKKDASIAQVDTTSETEEFVVEISSLQESGLHRTPSELRNKRAVGQTVMGGHLKYRRRVSHIGITAVHTRLDAPLVRRPAPYNRFEFTGDRLTNFGMDYALLVKNFYFFGEYAMSGNMGFSTIHGFISSLDPKVDIAVVFRHYQHDYQSLFSNPFSESRNSANEQGIYAGLTVKPIGRKLQIDTYLDYYRHPWLRFNIDAPSSGVDFFTQVTYKPSRTIEIYARYKNETKLRNFPNNTTKIDYLTDAHQQNTRLHFRYKVSNSVTLSNRIEMVVFDFGEQKEYGYLIYQDVDFKPLSLPISLSARFALFDTESFNSRIYAFEKDVLYAFSIPPYYNRGTRFYLMLRYRIVRGVDVWVRFAQTYWANRDTFGSGLETIEGNTRSEIKAQLRLKF